MGEDGVDADVVVQGRNKSSLGVCWIDWSKMFFSGEAVIGFNNETLAWAAWTAAALAATAAAWFWSRRDAAENGSCGSSCVCRSTVDGLEGFDVGGLDEGCAGSLLPAREGELGIILLI